MTDSILVIGASGGIGRAVAEIFANEHPHATVYALSRSATTFSQSNIVAATLATDDESAIKNWLGGLSGIKFRYVLGAMGILHGQHNGVSMNPEKRLEDISAEQLLNYFTVNSVVPSIWLKHLVNYVDKSASVVGFISARVGSIADNRMGGWYGYRASKAALNMVIKSASIEYRRRTKHTALLSYHPGTVDTPLSKPFQSNVKTNKLFTPEFTAQRLVSLMTTLNVDEGPYYLDWDGKTIEW